MTDSKPKPNNRRKPPRKPLSASEEAAIAASIDAMCESTRNAAPLPLPDMDAFEETLSEAAYDRFACTHYDNPKDAYLLDGGDDADDGEGGR